MERFNPLAHKYFGFKEATPEEIEEAAKYTKYEGGFQYCVPKTARDETIEYIQERLWELTHRNIKDVCIEISFIPNETWYALFPPTTPLPLGWSRYYTTSMTDKIVITKNYDTINYLLGPKPFWSGRGAIYASHSSILEFNYRRGITITRTKRGKFTIKFSYRVFTQGGESIHI